VAETNRAPFDLAEAESELVSGYMTEHAAGIFVSFFLGEYSSITLICIFISILFLGGYLFNIKPILYIIKFLINIIGEIHSVIYYNLSQILIYKSIFFNPIKDGLLSSYSLGFKVIMLIFAFILTRASYPRIRFDQLMTYC
jgi:NADH-ubiquinone oxidoreductase chain 1